MDSAFVAGLVTAAACLALAYLAGRRAGARGAGVPPNHAPGGEPRAVATTLPSAPADARKPRESTPRGTPGGDAAERDRGALLRAIVDHAPMAVLVFGATGRIAFSNAEARGLFAAGAPLEGENFLRLIERAPAGLREGLLRQTDVLFTLDGERGTETFGLARRELELDGEPQTLLMVKELTPELERQELDVWKKVIRVINHELNNSLAPILSMAQTARVIVKDPAQLPRLDLVFATIEERAAHLSAFLEGYARFARLPRPRPQLVAWSAFLDGFRALYPDIAIAEAPPSDGYFDPGQLQQVVINLLKNSREASNGAAGIELAVHVEDDGSATVSVGDRGTGMSDETLKSALLPFFSTKEQGTGLGLALAREIVEAHRGKLSIARRDGGGVEVACWLPGRSSLARRRTQSLTLTGR